MQSVFSGPVYVVRDNIDTDQIIPAQYLNLVPTIPEEYEILGSYALCGLPESLYATRYVKEGQLDSEYPIVLAGRNFGCGSSREHAPIALGSAGCKVVLAESFARIFFRNAINLGLAAVGSEEAAAGSSAGDELEIDLVSGQIHNLTKDRIFRSAPLDPRAAELLSAGGLIPYLKDKYAKKGRKSWPDTV